MMNLQVDKVDERLEKSSVTDLFLKGYELHRLGKLDQASRVYANVLSRNPNYFDALHLSGVIAHQTKNHQLAIELINRALKINDRIPEAYNNIGNAYQSLKMFDFALQNFDKAIALNSKFPDAFNNRGNVLQELKQYQNAVFSYNKAIELKNDYIDAYYNRAVSLRELKLFDEAVSSYEQAIAIKPEFAEAYSNKGNALHELNRFDEAIACFEKAIAIKPDFAIAYINLGNTYLVLGRNNKALEICRRAVELAPELAEAHCNFAVSILVYVESTNHTQYLEEAKLHIAKALKLDPQLPQNFVALGRLNTKHLHNRHLGQIAYENALEKDPNSIHAILGLVGIASDLGDRNRSRKLSEMAIEVSPNSLLVLENYIYTLNYDPYCSSKDIFTAAKKYGHLLKKSVGLAYTDWPWWQKNKKRIKIGFISGDFRSHPVSYFVVDLFKYLDRQKFEIHAYANNSTRDEMTSRINENVNHWRVIADLNTEKACEIIRADEIDVLIDLSGHTGHNRLDIFAKKPAPVSASWLGFVTTTGLDTVDYFLSTNSLSPEIEAQVYTEKLMYLPVWAAIDIINPQITPNLIPPCVKSGYITFASFNNFIKINDLVIDAWSEILRKVPCSKLWLNYKHILDEQIQKQLIKQFSTRGIGIDRLILEYTTPRSKTIENYARVDIALDTFPYGGGTTTYEAIYSGVPVITIKGQKFSARLTANILEGISGGEELITYSVDEYVSKAVLISSDREKLTELRMQMKKGFDDVLGNTRLFAEEFGKTITQMAEMRKFK